MNVWAIRGLKLKDPSGDKLSRDGDGTGGMEYDEYGDDSMSRLRDENVDDDGSDVTEAM